MLERVEGANQVDALSITGAGGGVSDPRLQWISIA